MSDASRHFLISAGMFIHALVLLCIVGERGFLESALVEYDFIVRSIPANPDGYPRRVIIMHHANASWDIERPFPGPLIRATFGDRLRIRLTNMLRDQSTSIHFHGLHMHNNPWADGTAHITQCPIYPHETFLYEFNVTQSGTFWYHSHNAQQYADGLYGPIIIDGDRLEQRYAYGANDHIIMLQEWYHESWPDLMTAYQGPYNAYPGNIPIYPWPPTSFLINGHGQFDCHTTNCSETTTWHDTCGRRHPAQCIPLRDPLFGHCKPNTHPADEFRCPHGQQIRLRLINAASGIPFRFWIDGHNFTIVARDSIEVSPIIVPHVHIAIGQRLDLIVRCDRDAAATYTIYAASRNSHLPPGLITGPTPTMWTWALLTYTDAPPSGRPTHFARQPSIDSDDPFFEYDFLKPHQPRLAAAAVRRVTLSFEVLYNNRSHVDALEEWSINGITFEAPKEPLLHGNFFDGTFNKCTADERPGRVNNRHVTYIEHFEYGHTYEVLMINYDPQLHPWHLHGYSMDFVAFGKIPGLPPASCNDTRRNLHDFNFDTILPPLNSTPAVLTAGDSFNIPRESYVVFRFTANNPGPWFLHCHMEWHIWPGMSVVFSVERKGRYEGLVDPPPANLSVCGQRRQLSTLQAMSLTVSSTAPTMNFAMPVVVLLLSFCTLGIDLPL